MTSRRTTAPSLAALAAVATLVGAPLPSLAETLRCEGGIVAVGDWKLDLLGKCGEPTNKEDVQVKARVFGLMDGSPGQLKQEHWIYDSGPSAFLHLVTLELGVVTGIERGGYGRDSGRPRPAPARLPRALCELSGGFSLGDSTDRVLARCGEPALREETRGQVPVWAPSGNERSVPIGFTWVRVELWTYDFGPRSNARRLEFEDGRLARIVTGGYGYSR